MREDLWLDPSARPGLRDGVMMVPVGQEAVLYLEAEGEMVRLDPVARLVCEYFDGRTTVDEAVSELARASGEPTERIRTDVTLMARQLERCGMLAVAAADDAPPDTGEGHNHR